MKKTIFAFIISVFIFNFLYSQNVDMQKPPPPSHPPLDCRLFESMGVNLSDKQKEAINNYIMRCQNEIKVYQEEIKKYSLLIAAELKKDSINKVEIKNLIQKKKSFEADLEYAFLMRDVEVFSVLSDEQKAMIKNHHMNMTKYRDRDKHKEKYRNR